MGTLAKVAMGYAAAKGVEKLADGGLGGLLGGGEQVEASEPAAQLQSQIAGMFGGGEGGNPMEAMAGLLQGGGLGDMMGGLMGGEAGANPMAAMMEKAQGAGLDLGALTGGGEGENPLAGLMSSLGGGAGLAGLMAAAGGAAAAAGGAGLGGLLDSFNTQDTSPEMEETAALMLRAMIQAAKSDGGIDEAEKAKILDAVGPDADEDDMNFIQAELAAPVDPKALADATPEAQRAQVYSASLMTIRVDTQAEAAYLDSLAKAMGLDEATVNALHMQMGLQPLYG
jgi:uncharacterized membrane protein YebE (DUF533 family)